RFDAGPQLLVLGVLDGRRLVELAQVLELVLLLAGEDTGVTRAKGERVLWVERELHPRVLWPQVIRMEVLLYPRVLELPEEDELRQVLVQAPKAIVDPRPDHRLLFVERVAAMVHLELGVVVVVGRVHGPDEGNIVNAFGQVGEPVADLDSRSTVLLGA